MSTAKDYYEHIYLPLRQTEADQSDDLSAETWWSRWWTIKILCTNGPWCCYIQYS